MKFTIYKIELRTAKNWFEFEPIEKIFENISEDHADSIIDHRLKQAENRLFATDNDAWGFPLEGSLGNFVYDLMESNDLEPRDIGWSLAWAETREMMHEIHFFKVPTGAEK